MLKGNTFMTTKGYKIIAFVKLSDSAANKTRKLFWGAHNDPFLQNAIVLGSTVIENRLMITSTPINNMGSL